MVIPAPIHTLGYNNYEVKIGVASTVTAEVSFTKRIIEIIFQNFGTQDILFTIDGGAEFRIKANSDLYLPVSLKKVAFRTEILSSDFQLIGLRK